MSIETIDIESIAFDPKKMLCLVKKDLLLKRMYDDLGKNENTLKVLFNSEVVGDSIMVQEYLNV